MLTDSLPANVPKPTIVIFSGGGYQAFWKLAAPIPIDGDVANAEDAKRYNQRLEMLLGGDNCHDISRIMRLPGTWNLPDAKKVAKGRLQALATIIECDMERFNPLSAFTPAPKSAPSSGRGAEMATAKSVTDLGELDQWNVPERVRVVIAQGHDPDSPKPGDNSRSIWLFDALCGLARCGVPDDVALSIITDAAWPISASVLDKGSKARSYAIRQIERAKDAAANPDLALLNEIHFVIENDGGKCRVAEWLSTRLDGLQQLSFQSFEDFRNRYMHIKTKIGVGDDGKAIMVSLGKFWLGHPRRRQYKGLVLKPGQDDLIGGNLNLWRGFGVEPAPGDWSLMQAHIREVLAAGDIASADYIRRWAAWALQNPAQQAEVALVFKGGQGTGKGTFARALAQLFGQHGMQVTSPMQFAGRFNAHLRDVCLLFADEAMRPDDKAARGVLKALLTEPELPLEGKGKDIISAPNYVKVVMASNEDWIVPTEFDDRRFAVFEVSGHKKQDEGYFAALNAEIANGGRAAMLHDLLSMPLGDWHPRRNIPQTGARNEQKAASLTGFAAVFLDLLREGALPIKDVDTFMVPTGLMQAYALRHRPRENTTLNDVAQLFRRLGFQKHDKSRPRGYHVPPLPEARALWDQKISPIAWDETKEWARIATDADRFLPGDSEVPPF